MKKIGRNDLCPCGSGKKFKKCCADLNRFNQLKTTLTSISKGSQLSEYLKKYESGHILNLVTELQLIKDNYGKNRRIELIADEAIKNLSVGQPGNYEKLKSIITSKYPNHHEEDLPEELLTENVLFFDGNYTVMPGINSYSVDIFKYLIKSIYETEVNLSKEFKYEVYQGVIFLLKTGEVLFTHAGLSKNLFIEKTNETITFPKIITNLSFTGEELETICKKLEISPSIIDQFVISPNNLKHRKGSLSQLLFKPFTKYNDNFYFVLPSGQVSALNNYILNVAKKKNVRDQIYQICHRKIWQDVLRSCDTMEWKLTDIPLPQKAANQSIIEGLFLFDTNKLAYVCYSFPSTLQNMQEMYSEQNNVLQAEEALNQRLTKVVTILKGRKKLRDYEFLTIVLINSMGGPYAMGLDEPKEYEKKIWFNVFDFVTLAISSEWRNLDIWKFAKVYQYTSQKAQIFSVSPIDSYAIYKENGKTFYASDKVKVDYLSILPGEGAKLIRKVKIQLDEHGVLNNIDGILKYQSVKRYRDYALIYKPIQERFPYQILLKTYSIPIWIQNFQVKSEVQASYVEHISEAIFFWLSRLYPALEQRLNIEGVHVLNIVLIFDPSFFEQIELEKENLTSPIKFSLQNSYKEGELTIKLPKRVRELFIGGDNAGERTLITNILMSLSIIPGVTLSAKLISDIIDEYMPLDKTKMIFLLDTSKDLRLDKRGIPSTFYVNDAETNLLLDRIVQIIDLPYKIPENFPTVNEKREFCNHVAKQLVKELLEKIKEFNKEKLLKFLMLLNERLVYDRENHKINIGAEIYCFGNNEERLAEILKTQNNLAKTSLATRCLIEFVTLVQFEGEQEPNFDQIDELLAIQYEIINYGMLSDIIHFEMGEPDVGLLPSGRIGISKEFFEQKLQPFNRDNTIENVEKILSTFTEPFEMYNRNEIDRDRTLEIDSIDVAFEEDWGVAYTTLFALCHCAAIIAEQKGQSVISMDEAELLQELKKIMNKGDNQIEAGLSRLCFEYKGDIVNGENGYISSDYYPWKYNRDSSYARRPFIVIDTESSRKYYWGIRQCLASIEYLSQLISSGSLTHGDKMIKRLLGRINNENGKRFRNEVMQWMNNNTNLKLFDYEVSIKPKGHLKANKDYGDCDIFAFDSNSKIVYNIECKRTESARNIHQMKKEIDAYLGRNGQRKKVAKHVERDNWLKDNLEKVKTFIGSENAIKVKSLILTSDLLPTRYLRKEEIPLPIISFHELKREGVLILEKANPTGGNSTLH